MEYSREELEKVFNETEKKQEGKATGEEVFNMMKALKLQIYKAKIYKEVININWQEKNPQLKATVNLEQFIDLVRYELNPLEKQFWQAEVSLRGLQEEIKELKGRDVTIRDREGKGSFTIRVGPLQEYFNSFRVWLKAREVKETSDPWINIFFPLEDEGKKEKLAAFLEGAYNMALQVLEGEKPELSKQLEGSLSFIHEITKEGVEVTIKFVNEKLNDIQNVFGEVVKSLFATEVNGDVEFSLKFNKSLIDLLNTKNQDYYLSIFEKDCEINIDWSVNRIMTALKEIIISSGVAIDLSYEDMHVPSLLLIFFSNMELIEGEIEIDNVDVELSATEKETYISMRNESLAMFSGEEEGTIEMFQQFNLFDLFDNIGNEIHVEASFGKFNIGIDVKVQDIKNAIYGLIGFNGERPERGSDAGSDDS